MKKLFVMILLGVGVFSAAQTPPPYPALTSLPRFPLNTSAGLSIEKEAVPIKPFSVVGPQGAFLGQQDGAFEAWLFPWKIFSGMRITAQMQDYPVPIELNQQQATIEVRPDHTTITFAHANLTVHEIFFAPRQATNGTGIIALYKIEAIRPVTLTFHFTPEMKRMWPASTEDNSPEWVKTQGGGGFYVLHQTLGQNAAAIGMPDTESGILPPYQEKPKTYPLEFVLRFDPAHDTDSYFPLLLAVGEDPQAATTAALAKKLANLDAAVASLYDQTAEYWTKFSERTLSIETPDEGLNEAFRWAEISIDQLRVLATPKRDETGLTAGFYASGDSDRPGFGWFFGRDSLWTLYAVESYGDFATCRDEFNFLIHRQREDGKIMHEFAQTADLVDWKSLPYLYASADGTLLYLMAFSDYVNVSGDVAFAREHWDSIERAWNFEQTHDTDGDGIYDNSQGTGWVESWPPGMPHQEIYLAALDQQASMAFARLAKATGHADQASAAEQRARRIAETIEKEYYLPQKHFYVFSRNADGTTDDSATIYPTVAAWDGDFSLQHMEPMLQRWASSEFSTDWGTRDLSPQTPFYDPISYHQGSVWPLFTGWTSLAEYRSGRPLSGYAHLMQNADLTWSQDLGNVTELLSGEYFQPFGRSTPHQLWSAAMVISPVLRGVFGLEWNAAGHSLTVTPNLPAEWDNATLHHVPLGTSRLDLDISREGSTLVVTASGEAAAGLELQSRGAGAKANGTTLRIPLPAVEIGISHGLPSPGSMTTQMKVLAQRQEPRSLTLELAAQAGSEQTLHLRINDQKIRPTAEGAQLTNAAGPVRDLQVSFPSGSGYKEKTVHIRW
jgi:glycogen debranching enzyme